MADGTADPVALPVSLAFVERSADALASDLSAWADSDEAVPNDYASALKVFVTLDNIKRAAAALEKTATQSLERFNSYLLEQFAEMGQASAKVNGTTIFIRRQWWAGAYKREDGVTDYSVTCDALRAAGLDAFVDERFNTNTLSSWVRELPTDELGTPQLPPEMEGKMTVSQTVKLQTRKG